MNTTTKVTIGVLAGTTVGILAGILLAPQSGRKTIKKLVGKTNDLKEKMTDSMIDVKKAYNKRVDALVDEGKSTIHSLKNSLKV
jgi:gas vesicle protein